MHLGIAVETLDVRQEILGRGLVRQLNTRGAHANALTGIPLHAHIRGRRRIITHQDSSQCWNYTVRQIFKALHALTECLFNMLRQSFAIQDGTSHACSYRSTPSCAPGRSPTLLANAAALIFWPPAG